MDEPTDFIVDVPRDAGMGKLSIVAVDVERNPVEVQMDMQPDRQTGNKRYTCRYTPKRNIKHVISICYSGIAIPSSPFRVRNNHTLFAVYYTYVYYSLKDMFCKLNASCGLLSS